VDSMVAVQNTDSAAAANVTLTFTPTPGAPGTAATQSATIPALASTTFDISSATFNGLGTTFLGSLSITSNTNVAAVAHSVRTRADGELSIYGGFSSGATGWLAPLVFNQWTSGDVSSSLSGIQVQNLGNSVANVTMTFTVAPGVPNSGGTSQTKSLQIAANASGTFYMPTLGLPAPSYGSATIQSDSGQIAVVVNNQKSSDGAATAYNAFPTGSGSTRLVAPLVFVNRGSGGPNDATGVTSGIQVQNAGTAADQVTMVFRPTNASAVPGAQASYSVGPRTLPANGSATFILNQEAIPAGLYGSAEVTSVSQNIIGVVNTTNYFNKISSSYTAFNQ